MAVRGVLRRERWWPFAVAVWLGLATPLSAQPLERGVGSGDGRHFVLDDGAISVLSKDFQPGRELRLEQPIAALFQGGTWDGAFLVQTDQGIGRYTMAGSVPQHTLVVPGEGLTVAAWGDTFVAYAAKGTELTLLTAKQERAISLEGALSSLDVVSPSLLIVRTEKELFALQQEKAQKVPLSLPFPLPEARVAFGGGRAALWSTSSEQVMVLSGSATASGDLDPDPQTVRLHEKPVYGVRVLEDGTVVSGGDQSLCQLSPEGVLSRHSRPAVISEDLFAGWPMAVSQGNLMVFFQDKDRTRVVHYRRRETPTDVLPAGKLLALVMPDSASGGQPMLFWETSSQEPKIDEQGRPVLDLASGRAAPPLSVTGHKIFALESGGRWNPVVDQPRQRLVGPIQRLGDRVVYAVQTEPPHLEGFALKPDPRYPYPEVQMHGRSMARPQDVWTFEKPRGEVPSKDRLPEGRWPLLGESGPLLVTSEAGNLLAIDPATGAQVWSSPSLPMDDSPPPMYLWSDGLALIATSGTTRSLLLVDPDDGRLLETLALTDTFFWERWRHLIGLTSLCLALAYYIYAAGRRQLYIRKISGLQALDEAVGRATEMGKPVLYVVGLADVDDIQTMASLSILSHVARKTAEYDTPIITTTSRAVAFSAAQEIVRDAFSVAGRPDAFTVESVRYISDDQFGYTAGVDGIMVREKPAANFYMGNFYAESLILAETGYATGSIQMAGTAQVSQIPFFVAACDYTLIGEELYAASAYLSRDPLQVGSLRGQDVGKALVMILLLVCSGLVTAGIDWATFIEMTGWDLP